MALPTTTSTKALGDCYFVSSLGEVPPRTGPQSPTCLSSTATALTPSASTKMVWPSTSPSTPTCRPIFQRRLIYANRAASLRHCRQRTVDRAFRREGLRSNERNGLDTRRHVGHRSKFLRRDRRRLHLRCPEPISPVRARPHLPTRLVLRPSPRLSPRTIKASRSALPRRQRRHQARSSVAMPTPSWAITLQTKPSHSLIHGVSNMVS